VASLGLAQDSATKFETDVYSEVVTDYSATPPDMVTMREAVNPLYKPK
jgi:hypothetical protein